MRRLISRIFDPYRTSPETQSLYEKICQLEDRILQLEEENVETSNCLYELTNSIDAVDARIDILLGEKQ